jgi:hypothetical protein
VLSIFPHLIFLLSACVWSKELVLLFWFLPLLLDFRRRQSLVTAGVDLDQSFSFCVACSRPHLDLRSRINFSSGFSIAAASFAQALDSRSHIVFFWPVSVLTAGRSGDFHFLVLRFSAPKFLPPVSGLCRARASIQGVDPVSCSLLGFARQPVLFARGANWC